MLCFGVSIAQNSHTSTYKSKSTSKTHQYRSNTGVSSTDLEYRGKIVFTDDDRDVKSISSGGFIKFSKRTFGTKRTIILEGNYNGTISREYREGSREVPYEPEGRKWLASVLPEIIRTTGLGAEARVARFYKNGGINAVLAEIEEINSNYVASIYYNEVFKMNGISNADLAKAVEHAGDHISSSYELAKLITGNMDQLLSSNTTTLAMVEAVSSISSDYEQAKVYKRVLKSNVDDNTVVLVIGGLDNIGSSYEKAGVLQAIINYELSDKSIELVLEEIAEINSSYEQSKVLQALIKEQGLNNVTTTMLLATAEDISSDYEKTKVVVALIENNELTVKEISAVADFSQSISSDYEQSRLLQQLINDESIDEAAIDIIIEMSASVGSSYEQSKILYEVLESNNFRGNNFLTVIEATEDISSDYESSKVLTKVIKHDNLEEKYYYVLIEAVSDISSSYEKAKLMMAMAPNLPETTAIRENFLEAAKDLSDTDYGKIMKALTY